MARAVDGKSFLNVSTTQGPFQLDGGQYGVDVVATFGGGSVTLQKLAADGSTYINAASAFTANGAAVVALPAGQYQVAIATATGVYINIRRIPGD